MIDIVIPFRSSQFEDKELFYCLKAIEKFLTGYRNIYIIGDKPKFEGNYIHIQAEDNGKNAQENILNKILVACDTPEISRNFLMMNDDHIMIQPMNVGTFQYYYYGDLHTAWLRKNRSGKKGSYALLLKLTGEELEKHQYATYHFDIHVPIIYEKESFKRVMSMYPWKSSKYGFAIKSLYANTLMIPGVELPDSTVCFPAPDKETIDQFTKDRFVFSFDEGGANDVMFSYLKALFP